MLFARELIFPARSKVAALLQYGVSKQHGLGVLYGRRHNSCNGWVTRIWYILGTSRKSAFSQGVKVADFESTGRWFESRALQDGTLQQHCQLRRQLVGGGGYWLC